MTMHQMTVQFCDADGFVHGLRTVVIERAADGTLWDDDAVDLVPEAREAGGYGLRGPGGWAYLLDADEMRAIGVDVSTLAA